MRHPVCAVLGVLALGGPHLGAGHLVLLLLAALVAGWVDAVVGGGGLVQLPALLLVPGIAPVQALATNKLAGFAGTATSAATYARRVGVDRRTAVPTAVVAGCAAAGGAGLAHLVPAAALRPVVLVALVAVAVWTLLRRPPGEGAAPRGGRRHVAAATGLGLVVGAYDGALGPGTGSFLVAGLVGLGYAFLPASAAAKAVNAATNLGALAVFTAAGSVLWPLGAAMAAANMTGGYLGARTAVARGSAFVRVAFLVVVGVLVVRLGLQVAGDVLGR